MSHSAGVTYWRWTAYSSGSSAPQLSHVDVTGTASTLTPTVTAVSWRLLAAVAAASLAVAACGDDDAAPALTSAAAVTADDARRAAPSGATPTTTADADVPPAPTTTEAAPTTTGRRPGRASATVAGRVTAADGSTCDVCLWVAEHARRAGARA